MAAAIKALLESTLGGLSYGSALANAVSVLVIALGVIAALDQLGIARNVVDAVLYAALAAIVGVVIVAVGGGGIGPMAQRWQRMLDTYDQEKPKVQGQVRRAPSPGDQATQAIQELRSDGSTGATRY